jgi:hypothetical protein
VHPAELGNGLVRKRSDLILVGDFGQDGDCAIDGAGGFVGRPALDEAADDFLAWTNRAFASRLDSPIAVTFGDRS